MASQTVTPEVLWAQRASASDPERNYVFVTISVPDIPKDKLKLDVQPTKLTFTGTSTSKKTTYHVEIDLYAEIDPSATKTHHSGKNVELVLRKKELGEEFWPRLLKDKGKVHYLRTDFDKWVDEDEQDAAQEDDDYMSRMGGGDGDFGGIDFSKLGGAGAGDFGAGPGGFGAGPGGFGAGEEDEEGSSGDEDIPELEDEGKETKEAKKETPAHGEPSAEATASSA